MSVSKENPLLANRPYLFNVTQPKRQPVLLTVVCAMSSINGNWLAVVAETSTGQSAAGSSDSRSNTRLFNCVTSLPAHVLYRYARVHEPLPFEHLTRNRRPAVARGLPVAGGYGGRVRARQRLQRAAAQRRQLGVRLWPHRPGGGEGSLTGR